MQEPEIPSTADLSTNEPVAEQAATRQPHPLSLSSSGVVKMIAQALAGGNITRNQARDLRKQMGISNSFFRKAKKDPSKAKRKKKLAEASRKRNRGLGKGQKRTGGNGVYTRT